MLPSGKRFELAVCTVYGFDGNDRLAFERVYFDGERLAAQLRG